MKYKTFRALVLTAGAGAVLAAVVLAGRACSSSSPPSAPRAVATSSPVTTTPTKPPVAAGNGAATPPPNAPAGEGALRPMDQAILARVDQGISGDKVKDAFPSQSYKVNLYRDSGQSGVNRLKIDLDRDGKWDEKWTLSGSGAEREVKREVAPADDEKYTETYRLRAGAWVKK